MSRTLFEFLGTDEFAGRARELFDILADNMSVIAPTGNSRDEDYAMWLEAVSQGLSRPERSIIVISREGETAGYFQYYVNADTFMMEEIQLKPCFQGRLGIFRELYGFVLPQIHENVKYVGAFANKSNARSRGILEHLGLRVVGENASGTSCRYRGSMDELRNWLGKKQ